MTLQRTSKRRPSKTGQASSEVGKLTLPPGTDLLSVRVYFKQSEFDLKKGIKALGSLPTFQVRSDNAGFRGILTGGKILRSAHAHLEVARDRSARSKKTGSVWLELEMFPGEHGRISNKTLRFEEGISILMGCLESPAKPRSMMVGANLSLSLKDWEPTVPLPYTPGSFGATMPGVAKICGVDFAFADPSASQPMLRGFVTTYDAIDQMVVRLLLRMSAVLDTQVAERAIKLAMANVVLFVRKRPPVTED
jgi:hypothetical protein